MVEADSFTCAICSMRGHLAEVCTQSKECHRCKQFGHMKQDCPNPVALRNTQCYRCGEYGHVKQDCENPKVLQCSRCSAFGHRKSDCPAIGQSTIKCNKCHQVGHYLRDCPLRGCKLGLKRCHEMKYVRNAMTKPDNNYAEEQFSAKPQQIINDPWIEMDRDRKEQRDDSEYHWGEETAQSQSIQAISTPGWSEGKDWA